MDSFLQIMETLFNWMRNNGFPINIGSFSGFMSFWNLFIGIALLDIAIYWLFRFLSGE